MLSFDQALKTMLDSARILSTERVPWTQCVGRVLAETVVADRDLPPFDKSAMDGWACFRADLGKTVHIGETVLAGSMPQNDLTPGHCARVMTGAPVPAGTEVVVKFEDAAEASGGKVTLPPDSHHNICRLGEDLRAGRAVLFPGMIVGPAHLAVLATLGHTNVKVIRRPKVAVIATGSELVEAHQIPGPAAIRDSNSVQICAQVTAIGAEVLRIGIVADEREALLRAVAKAKTQADVVVLSGGVSEGDLDLVPEILEASGYRLLFSSVAMQPGRPTVFGFDGRTWCLGLPGNPVSTYVITELLLRPFLLGLMGHEHSWPPILAKLSKPWSRRRAERQITIPVVWTGPGTVAAIEYHGSAHIDALCRANACISVPVGVTELSQGSDVHVRLL